VIVHLSGLGATLAAGQIYDYARSAGFPPDTAVKMVAIALRESGGRTEAYNGKPPDDSYGLWQINMLGTMGDQRLKAFGISDASELFNPATNAHAAYVLWGGNDRNLATAWYIDRNTAAIPYKDRYEAYLPVALAAAQSRGEAGGGPVLASSPPAAAAPSGPAAWWDSLSDTEKTLAAVGGGAVLYLLL